MLENGLEGELDEELGNNPDLEIPAIWHNVDM